MLDKAEVKAWTSLGINARRPVVGHGFDFLMARTQWPMKRRRNPRRRAVQPRVAAATVAFPTVHMADKVHGPVADGVLPGLPAPPWVL